MSHCCEICGKKDNEGHDMDYHQEQATNDLGDKLDRIIELLEELVKR